MQDCSEQNGIPFQRYCFRYGPQLATYQQAMTACDSIDGTLSELTTKATEEFLRALFVSSLETKKAARVWIGGHQIGQNWEWITTGKSVLDSLYLMLYHNISYSIY